MEVMPSVDLIIGTLVAVTASMAFTPISGARHSISPPKAGPLTAGGGFE
jgi:hypothetical protein